MTRREATQTLAITAAVTVFALGAAVWFALKGHWPFALVMLVIAIPWRKPRELVESVRVVLNR